MAKRLSALYNDHLQAELKLLNPLQLHITSIKLYNFCLWATKEIECRKQPGSKKKLLKKSDLESMLCDQGSSKPAANDPVAHANDLYHSVLNNTMASSNNSWKVDAYLQKLKDDDDCFDYPIARDAATGVPTAVVWQTETNWSDFELYGCQLHLDFMMRRMNSYLWPYISVVVVDANGSPRCALEGIACSERVPAYIFAVRALLEMSPGRTRDEVLAIFANGKLEPTVLLPKNMNLPKASFFWDRYHVLNDIFPKRFGWVWERLSPYMESMIHAMHIHCRRRRPDG